MVNAKFKNCDYKNWLYSSILGAQLMKILVVDDERAVLDAYKHILTPSSGQPQEDALQKLASSLFLDAAVPAKTTAQKDTQVTFCSQGLEAIEAIERALAEDAPFRLAFIDIRMPPGIDGKETARRIRLIDPNINLVIVSAYSDYNVTDISAVAGPADKIFYISKPFASAEISQMATALVNRWYFDTRQVDELNLKVNELAASEARAVHIANHDFLTGAPNRMSFQRTLTDRVRAGDKGFALALLDLDRFKHVNDTFGHGAGDDLLTIVYQSIREQVPPSAVVARLGGDEFAIIVDTTSLDQAQHILSGVIDVCARRYTIFGDTVQIGGSIGWLLASAFDDSSAVDLMRFCDIALYAAKKDGRSAACLFDAEMDENTKFKQSIESGLKHAIENGELALQYQPIVDRNTLNPVGVEALLRWTSPVHGPVSPSVFIPIAEESGLIHEIGDWVVRRALEDSLNWPDYYISINISPRQFRRIDLVGSLCEHADNAGVPYNRVQLEITETALFDDASRASLVLAELQALGFRIALDDFGTGYSSLLNVKNFRLDCIKIDKSFVNGLGTEPNAAAIISSITHLAKGIGLNVVAEGVETEAQCQALRLVGCSHLQGFLFGAAEDLVQANLRYAGRNGLKASAVPQSLLVVPTAVS